MILKLRYSIAILLLASSVKGSMYLHPGNFVSIYVLAIGECDERFLVCFFLPDANSCFVYVFKGPKLAATRRESNCWIRKGRSCRHHGISYPTKRPVQEIQRNVWKSVHWVSTYTIWEFGFKIEYLVLFSPDFLQTIPKPDCPKAVHWPTFILGSKRNKIRTRTTSQGNQTSEKHKDHRFDQTLQEKSTPIPINRDDSF